MKIVSLVPSLTETLFDLGLGERLVGRTRFCIRPESRVDNVRIIGGTKNPGIPRIRELQPDFVLANKEENRKEDIEELQGFTTVHITEIKTVNDALASIEDLGELLDRPDRAHQILDAIRLEMQKIPQVPPAGAVYMIWRNPWMNVGGDTYISDVMRLWKLDNMFSSERRYPEISLEKLAAMEPQYILLSSEPFPFREEHVKEILGFCSKSSVVLVDGQWFSWYGSRMISAFKALNKWRVTIG